MTGGNPPLNPDPATQKPPSKATKGEEGRGNAAAAAAGEGGGRTTHRANCQCGKTRFKVTLPQPFPEYQINRCTCSICTKNGYLLVYPMSKDVEWISGYEDLGEFRFATKKKIHKFCKDCGSSIMIDFAGEGRPDVAINARMFTDIDFENDDLSWDYWDGMNQMSPKYNAEEFWGKEDK